MNQKAFICTNRKQILGAQLAKFCIERALGKEKIPVEIIVVEDIPAFQKFNGTAFKRGEKTQTYTFDDLQSFTLTRFMPPKLMGYEGHAFVIDPDIFALSNPLALFSYLQGNVAIAACRKKDVWDTSVMVLDCGKLSHWNVEDMLEKLKSGEHNYDEYMSLTSEKALIIELPRSWNSLDRIDDTTLMVHTTNRLTQPWKTGLPIDFTRNRLPKIAGIIPREPLFSLMGKYPSTYQSHPDKKIEQFFFTLVRDALSSGAVTREQLEAQITEGNVRKDLLQHV